MKINKTLTVFTSILALALTSQAQNDISAAQTTTISSWTGTQAFETGSTPEGNSGGSTADNDNWGGNANGTAGNGALGESFELSAAGNLSSVELILSGATATFNVELYDLGTASSLNYPGTVGGAAPITQENALGSSEPNLLSTADQFTYTTAASAVLETLTFSGADANVTLQTGEVYLLSLDPTAASDSTWWLRGAVPVAGYNNGEGFNADGVAGMQNFEGKTSIRNFDTAVEVTTAPEPASLALLGLGGLAGAFMIRRKA